MRIAEIGLRVTGLYSFGRRRALNVCRTDVRITLPTLPGIFHGYRILYIADPHVDAIDGLADAIVRAVGGSSVDICILNGDYRAGFSGDFGPICRELSRIAGSVQTQDGIVALLGNHESYGDVDLLEAAGFRVLINETVSIRRGEKTLRMTGVDDVHLFYTAQALEALERAKNFDQNDFGIALVHSPELASQAAEMGYRLYLCGHTHGGQICFPGGLPIMSCVYTHRQLARRGVWHHEGMTGFTSSGAGVSALPLRYFSFPEVTILTLLAE